MKIEAIGGIREILTIPGYTTKNEVAEIRVGKTKDFDILWWRRVPYIEPVFARRRPSSQEMEQYRQLATYLQDVLGKEKNS